ncbi:MAG TPA: hypothetical protein PKD55_05375, partial [Bellilinea sp.]|nr:hypothetical protein [Bellilinea sp.]
YRDELIALKVPVNNIEISDAVRGVALVVLQSQSENNRLILEDYRNSILGLRAGAVAARDSKAVRSVKVQIVNKSGAVIDETQLFFYPEDETKFSQQTARALTNAQVEDVVHKLLDTHGLEMESLRILDHSGAILNGRELDIVLVSRDPQSVNYDVN